MTAESPPNKPPRGAKPHRRRLAAERLRNPDAAVPPPGETVREWLEENGHTQVWLAKKLNTSPKQVNRIVKGYAAYGADLALRLADVTGISARFWMNLQSEYQISIARKQHASQQAQGK